MSSNWGTVSQRSLKARGVRLGAVERLQGSLGEINLEGRLPFLREEKRIVGTSRCVVRDLCTEHA